MIRAHGFPDRGAVRDDIPQHVAAARLDMRAGMHTSTVGRSASNHAVPESVEIVRR